MKFSFFLLCITLFISCTPTPSWRSYTYDGKVIAIQNDVVLSENQPPNDLSLMEFVVETNCTIAEANAHQNHAEKKFLAFKQKMQDIRPSQTDFCVGTPHQPIEFHFQTKEQGSIPLDWGIEMRNFSLGERTLTIGYIKRSGMDEAVMYTVTKDSVTEYSGYNNLLYRELLTPLQ